MVYNYTDAEAKVREATSNDPWGPSSAVMSELSDYTYHIEAYGMVMGMLWKRLNDHGKNWRHVYKVWAYMWIVWAYMWIVSVLDTCIAIGYGLLCEYIMDLYAV